ncbi:hypothetical protein PILCRDRAFT_821225 [Piloderma croceum F 1598]|uniref:Uncharacterized protein n=1 Tax=Piloderma croceum (strain F 1598) TaxID=765440 RepID=A0A0C3FQ69_PILCF|nr:hypothetical protein PILCRDRAFT_821225 [Piloderma croceum F 1598]
METADAVDLSTPLITISCTAVLMSRSRQEPLQSHTFFSIPINHIFLGKRTGVNSILIGTLICVLQEQMLSGCEVSDDITRIISAVGSDSPDQLDLETITVATTRIPVFGDDMQNPIYGYRSLCTLLSVYVDTEFTSIAIQPDSELLAVRSDDNNPITKNFARVWAPCGLELETHFIVILTHTPAPSLDGSPFLFRDISTSPAPISRPSSVVQPSPLGIPVSADWLRGLSNASPNISRSNSPASGIGASHCSLSNSPASVVAQIPQTASSDIPVFGPDTPIETICHHYGVTDENIRSAKFMAAERSSFDMTLNYQGMLHILAQLGFQELDAPFITAQAVTLTGGLTLSAGDVVKEFGWSTDSFEHKRV